MIKKIGSLILILLSLATAANGVTIKVNPSSPSVGEEFEIKFIIPNNTSEKPFISFDQSNLIVKERQVGNSTIATSFVNGKFTKVKKEDVYIYKVLAKKIGTVRLSNIEVDLGGKVLKHSPITFRVTEKRKTNKKFFLEAELSSDDVYIGEGVDVGYYLYYRVNIAEPNIKKFPKLNGFTKRFHNKRFKATRVYINGVEYGKLKVYSARLYPQKTGRLVIDPIDVEVRFNSGMNNSNFGSFSFGFSRTVNRDVTSKATYINVNELPPGAPNNFTGLIGEHTAKLSVPKNKYLINEVVEVSMEVQGPGELEALDEMQIYNNEVLEKFDTKSKLVELDLRNAKKTFDYTYLVRNNGKIEGKPLRLSYFDPTDQTYKFSEVSVPELILGGSNVVIRGEDRTPKPKDNNVQGNVVENSGTNILAPVFENRTIAENFIQLKYINIGLFFIAIVFVFLILMSGTNVKGLSAEENRMLKSLKKNGNYSNLSRLIWAIDGKKKTNGDLREIVKVYKLENAQKIYGLIDNVEKEYYKGKSEGRVKVDKKVLNSLKKGLLNELS
ncbi:MAG: protein BatD [Oligoflexia bacterium]|nr:protein BatD [Oligoflexia bacterium]